MAHLSLPLKGLLQDTESKTAGYTPPPLQDLHRFLFLSFIMESCISVICDVVIHAVYFYISFLFQFPLVLPLPWVAEQLGFLWLLLLRLYLSLCAVARGAIRVQWKRAQRWNQICCGENILNVLCHISSSRHTSVPRFSNIIWSSHSSVILC